MSALALQSFGFEGQTVRVSDRDGAPWFVAQDVCAVLEIINHSDAVSKLDEDERDGVGITDPMGRQQITTIVSESGLYSLIFKSRKPAAKRFRKWVTSEVLPTLRTTGRYVMAVNDDGGEIVQLDTPDQVENLKVKLSLVRVVSHLYGKAAGRNVYEEVGLPPINLTQEKLQQYGGLAIDPSFRKWLAERTIVHEGARAGSLDLFSDYQNWCADTEFIPASQTKFGRMLSQFGFQQGRSNRCYRLGIRLKD